MRSGLLCLTVLAWGCTSAPTAKDTPGIFVLGVDGMDPVILQRMVDEGELPAFAQLIEDGGFQNGYIVAASKSCSLVEFCDRYESGWPWDL